MRAVYWNEELAIASARTQLTKFLQNPEAPMTTQPFISLTVTAGQLANPRRVADTMASRKSEFTQMAMPHLGALLRVATRLVGEASYARDVVEETYLRAWDSFPRSPAEISCKVWLFKVMLDVIGWQDQGDWQNSGMAAQGGEELGPFSTAQSPMLPALGDQDVTAALDAMPLQYRHVLLLAMVERFTCKEIAGILAVPTSVVVSRLSDARTDLRHRLLQSAERQMQPGM